MAPQIRFVSWNTRGIKNTRKFPQKHQEVVKKLEETEFDIAFIQETHIGQTKDHWKVLEKLEKDKNWKVFFTVHSARSKGVAILIKDGVNFQYICHDEDYCGGYIVLFCRLYGQLYTLVNLYNHKNDKEVLGRLKDYLMETAEGVLLIGGDFNTTFDPFFDRQSSSSNKKHSSFKAILEDFIAALNLRDIWSYKHPALEGFTRRQNESRSRIDMFLTPEDTVRCVSDIKLKKSCVREREISDHKPLVLTYRSQKQTNNRTPHVAFGLEDIKYTPDRTVGKINGAEILSAIKSLTDSRAHRHGEHDVAFYKAHRCPMTEVLKTEFNKILEKQQIPEVMQQQYSTGGGAVDAAYFIFLQILARRLNEITALFFKEKRTAIEKQRRKKAKSEGKKREIGSNICTIIIQRKPQVIKSSFLEETIKTLKAKKSLPPWDFSILNHLLPPLPGSFKAVKCLQEDCALTKVILDLTLRQLEHEILEINDDLTTSVCFHRQSLCIYGDLSRWVPIDNHLKDFMGTSGIRVDLNYAQM